MKKFAIVFAALALSLSATQAFACGGNKAACNGACLVQKAKASSAKATTKPAVVKPAVKKDACSISTTFQVTGMECQSCADKVTQELKGVKGVEAVSVDYQKGQASVDYCSEELTDTNALIKAVEKAGFGAKFATEASKAPQAH